MWVCAIYFLPKNRCFYIVLTAKYHILGSLNNRPLILRAELGKTEAIVCIITGNNFAFGCTWPFSH